MSRTRLLVLALLALALGAGGVWLLLQRRERPTLPPEAARSYFLSAVVHFVTEKQPHAVARNRSAAALERIRGGTPFEEVASADSQDDTSRLMGGFVGLIETQTEDMNAFRGAAQMLDEGEVKGPVWDGRAWLVLKRHAYEDGRALERRWLRPYFALRVAHREIQGGGPPRSRDEARALANTAVEELRAGKITFPQARARYGEPDETPVNGWQDLLRLQPQNEAIHRVLSSVEEGGVPDVVETPGGFLVMRRGRFFRSVVRHIAVHHVEGEGRALHERKLKPEALARAQEALERAQADPSKWDELVRSYSDDLRSVEDRGFLGCLAPGSLPPSMEALETAILETPPGKIHPRVVESSFGYHVLWRVD